MVPPRSISSEARASRDRRRAAFRRPASRARGPPRSASRPTDAVTGRLSGRKTCAAEPANSALACGVRNRAASTVAGSAGAEPEPGHPQRVARPAGPPARARPRRGRRSPGPAGPNTPRQAVRRRRARRRSRRASGPSRPPSRRRAGARGRPRGSARPGRARPAAATARNGEATPNGCTAEQTSCRRPGHGQLRGARAAADRVRALEHRDRPARLGERDRGGQPVGPGADDDGVQDHAVAGADEVTCTGTSWSVGCRSTMSSTSTYPRSSSPVAASTSR